MGNRLKGVQVIYTDVPHGIECSVRYVGRPVTRVTTFTDIVIDESVCFYLIYMVRSVSRGVGIFQVSWGHPITTRGDLFSYIFSYIGFFYSDL